MARTNTLDEFMAEYNPDGKHPVTEITTSPEGSGTSPFIVVRFGKYTAVVNPLEVGGYLDIDVHAFVDGQDATASALGFSEGKRVLFPETGATSNGWPSVGTVAVIIGEQG